MGWGRVGTRLSAELCVILIVFFLPYPVKFYLIYSVQSFARSHWPLWRNAVCTAAPLPSKEKWIGERDCLLFFVFVLFVCLFLSAISRKVVGKSAPVIRFALASAMRKTKRLRRRLVLPDLSLIAPLTRSSISVYADYLASKKRKWIACEQAVRGALVAWREKEERPGEFARRQGNEVRKGNTQWNCLFIKHNCYYLWNIYTRIFWTCL